MRRTAQYELTRRRILQSVGPHAPHFLLRCGFALTVQDLHVAVWRDAGVQRKIERARGNALQCKWEQGPIIVGP